MELSVQQQKEIYGKGFLDSSDIIMFLILTAGITGVLKIIFSSKGKVTFFGITFQWGR